MDFTVYMFVNANSIGKFISYKTPTELGLTVQITIMNEEVKVTYYYKLIPQFIILTFLSSTPK